MQRYTFNKGIVLLQLISLFLLAGSGFAEEIQRDYLTYSDALVRVIDKVNRRWNRRIRPKSDMEHYGVPGKWTYPDDRYGDCEEYAIAKKKELSRFGIPSFFALCIHPTKRTNHAVLFVFTTKGALVLDNLTNRLEFVRNSHYEFLVVQFPGDVWKRYKTGEIILPPEGYQAFIEGQ